MAHEPLPPVPVIDLPREVAEDLIADGHAEAAPNLHTYSAGFWRGVLVISGGVAAPITIVEAMTGGIRAVARRLHRWHAENPVEAGKDSEPKQRLAAFRASKGSGSLDLNTGPDLPPSERTPDMPG